MIHPISPAYLTVNDLRQVSHEGTQLVLSDEAKNAVEANYQFLKRYTAARGEEPTYGINTGFGNLHNIKVPHYQLEQLQLNLVLSHACGYGRLVEPEIVRHMLLLKIQSLSYGNSAIRPETLQRLVDMYNHNIIPVVFEQGSLGASGDLVPLAHMSLPLIGMGEVYMDGLIIPAADALKHLGWEPLVLDQKEGLALLNGTQFMSGYGLAIVFAWQQLWAMAQLIATLSLDAFQCKHGPFHPKVQYVRPHAGQIHAAEQIRMLWANSPMGARSKTHTQDPYSFRCIPQVHGASWDAMTYVTDVFLTEWNSVTDNPLVFEDENAIISGGNFHGQPLAIAADTACIAIAEMGNISERRTYQLLSGARGLPEFLTDQGGLNSGLMIPQYVAASLVSQNKQLATPASVDSILSSNGQEDHVSMGANAVLKAWQVVQNLEGILAIELLTAAQAMDYRRPELSSPAVEDLLSAWRSKVPSQNEDRYLHPEMVEARELVKKYPARELLASLN